MKKRDRFKPAVNKTILLLIAGLTWLCVGAMLLHFAYSWLHDSDRFLTMVISGSGILVALFVHHFGFLKLADKNIERILPMAEKKCIFSFITWKSYILIIVMVTMGMLLRQSAVPKQYLAILYAGIGSALILSSIRYIRIFIAEVRNKNTS